MANFKIAFDRTSKFEGGYVNDKADRGGETYVGIARNFHPNWRGWVIIDQQKHKPNFPANLKTCGELEPLISSFYKSTFWDAVWGDKIVKQSVANDLYDTAVNMGVAMSIRLSQKQFGLAETGKMNQELLNKLNSVR